MRRMPQTRQTKKARIDAFYVTKEKPAPASTSNS
jgi:hypothetical protein